MKKRIFIFLLSLGLCWLSFFSFVRLGQADEEKLPSGTPYSQIGQKIEAYYKKNQETSAGLAAAIVNDKGQTIYQGNFGYMDKENKLAVDEQSVFEWGSVTKFTVWVSVMQLWEEGKINLQADIKDYLPKDFFKGKLKYDKPITMLDLMNHRAGFDEVGLHYGGDKNLGKNLSQQPIAQIWEPGTVTAYSNFGTALAGHIVERVSGQSYVDYVHEHIFQPLNMQKTAILPDYSDNTWVQEKRQEERVYDNQGKLLGQGKFSYYDYPAGQAISSIADLKAFASALLQRKTLFQRPETWTEFYSATSHLKGTDISRSHHGLWNGGPAENSQQIYHDGVTIGFSSELMLDLEAGIALVLSVNQRFESKYIDGLPQLVFAKREKVALEKEQQGFTEGFYRAARSYHTGPLRIANNFSDMYTFYLNKENVGDYWIADRLNGRERVSDIGGDYFKLSNWDLIRDYGLIALWFLATVYALVRLILALFSYFSTKKKQEQTPSWSVWKNLIYLAILLASLNFLYMAHVMLTTLGVPENWQFMVYAGLGLVFLLSLVFPLFARSKWSLTGKQKLETYIGLALALIMLVNILYWSLYQWWRI